MAVLTVVLLVLLLASYVLPIDKILKKSKKEDNRGAFPYNKDYYNSRKKGGD